jgi:homogentisate 1,2-dioxygenase
MPHYQRRGLVPPRRHTVLRVDGTLVHEELVSREGFSDDYANLYHLRMPTAVRAVGETSRLDHPGSADVSHRHRHLRTDRLAPGGDWLGGRRVLAHNADVSVAVCEPTAVRTAFYRNARADELVFVHHGAGVLESPFGDLACRPGDYVVIPRGVTHRWRFATGRVKLLVLESAGPVRAPQHFRSDQGQLMEHAPYCERDLRTPEFHDPVDAPGPCPLTIKVGGLLQEVVLAHDPRDLVGWDGCYYPWAFSIHDFMPVVGKVHLPPPVHLTFTAPGFVVCSFVPRPFDFHPEAVPIPYAHSNVDSDEVLYYVEGEFMSRRGIESGSVTLHPMGYPHGPQPGLLEKSLGARGTDELAVMIDTFAPLAATAAADAVDDPDYPFSWLDDEERT